ncbi:hypothetical protein [Sodalis-like endosymbiont of Proechinophthirus fluctus]|uniref:hypothetical protein n=1 Tax=Sodalis-like endosymbiont of Proechinophthirus fluctus TaxID=1462730 RepID=UPI00082C0367|nr:hypothetical protein [Sodalis-like endosymbiont of Proechinophthirus fluctus]
MGISWVTANGFRIRSRGYLHDVLQPLGASFIGYWPTDGYEFISQKAVTPTGDHFVSLALDEVNHYDFSERQLQQ